jgi:hypothetical protein
MGDGNHEPTPLPDEGTATVDEIDRRLDWHDGELADVRDDIDLIQESIQASLDGDHQRAAELLNELEEGDQ